MRRTVRPAALAIPREELGDLFDAFAGPRTAEEKLAELFRDLAEKVVSEGRDGNLDVGGLRVINYRIDVMIYLRDTSAKTVEALKTLGFVQTGESKAIKLLIGTIDVRKLLDLAKLEAVIRVTPIRR